jgi:glycosyltransferase involved in cell wall biosynthesis
MSNFSIIIPTLNRASLLELAIKSFCLQKFSPDNFEIFVVDNGSTDNTKDITETAINAFPSHKIRYICEPEPGLLSGRHRGVLEAKGEICIFVDDDIEADPGWLNAISESFQDPSVQLVGGRNLPKYETEPPEWLKWFWVEHPFGKLCGELSLLDFGDNVQEIDANYVWGLNFSIRRQALFDLGGFHPDCIAKHLQHFQGDGETGLTIKANETAYKAIYQPQALVWHQVPESRMTYKYFEQRYFYQGVCNSYTEIRNLESLPKTNYMQSVKELLKTPFRAIKQLIRNTDNTNTEEKVLKTKLHQSFINGVNFHRTAIRQNPQLLEWVMKKDYWDYKLPKY